MIAMRKNLYSGFIFDFDGVLADSVNLKTHAFAALFQDYGKEIQKKVIEYHLKNGGKTRREKLQYYYSHIIKKPLENIKLEALCQEFSSIVVDQVIGAPEITGASDFLEAWYTIIPCFVVSATPDGEIKTIVEKRNMGKYFREVLGSNKSKFENIEYLIDKYRLEPKRCIFFGDTMNDYTSSKRCNLQFIGIASKHHDSLKECGKGIDIYDDFYSIQL